MNNRISNPNDRKEREQRDMGRLLGKLADRQPVLREAGARIVYPGCGTDDVLERTFPAADITYIDSDEQLLGIVRQRAAPNAGPRTYLRAEIADVEPQQAELLFIRNLTNGFNTLAEGVVAGGKAVCNENEHWPTYDALAGRDDFALEAVIRPKTWPEWRVEAWRLAKERHFRGILGIDPVVTETENIQDYDELARTEKELQASGMRDVLEGIMRKKHKGELWPWLGLLQMRSNCQPKKRVLGKGKEGLFVLGKAVA